MIPLPAQAASYEELLLLQLINQHRAANGLGTLILSDRLTESAHGHSHDMATRDYFSHDSLDGTGFADRIRAAGYTYSTALGENIAAGQWRAADVFNGWKSSPAHNAIMLGKSYKAVGISRVFGPESRYQWYWTADFGGVADSSLRAAQLSESTNWAYSYIQWLVKQGAVSGYSDGTFRPENPITRAEFSKMIVKSLDIPLNGSTVFRDTKYHWARDYIAALAGLGYISGYSDGTFRPNNLITRAEMVKIVTKAGGLTLQSGSQQSFTDISGHWAKEYIIIASSNGIVNGYENGKFRPDICCLRADTAASLYRLVNN